MLENTEWKVRPAIWWGAYCIFRGFYQIPPVAEEIKALYTGNSVQRGGLNAVIFLVKNHNFKDDRECGELLKRIAKGEATRKDIEMFNSRVITGKKIVGRRALPNTRKDLLKL